MSGQPWHADPALVRSLVSDVPENMRSAAEKSIPLILQAAHDNHISDPHQIAYILATARHEAGLGLTMHESGDGVDAHGHDKYFDRYNAGTELGAELGNTEPGDGQRFKGRVFVQVTGRNHYIAYSKSLDLPPQQINGKDEPYLVAHPEKLESPEIAAQVLAQGMRDGAFTGAALEKYINAHKVDYVDARRVVNGTDRAELIAGYAKTFEKTLDKTFSQEQQFSHEPLSVPGMTVAQMIARAEMIRAVRDGLNSGLKKSGLDSPLTMKITEHGLERDAANIPPITGEILGVSGSYLMLQRSNGDRVGIEYVQALAASHDIAKTQAMLEHAYRSGETITLERTAERGFSIQANNERNRTLPANDKYLGR